MNSQNLNIASFSAFMESVKNFNPFELRDKSSSEVIELGLGVFTNLSECREAALFLLDTEEYEFTFRASTLSHEDTIIKEIFEQLNNDGGVAAALSGSEIVEWTLNNSESESSINILIPLIAQAGVIGLIILDLSNEIFDKGAVYSVFRMHSNYFAMHLYTYDLIREVVNLKEVTEQKIAIRTKDIIKSSRELKNIIEMVQAGIMLVSCETNMITDANVMTLEIMNTVKGKLLGTPRDSHFLLKDGMMNSEQNIINKEVLLVRENGTLVPVILTSVRVTINEEEFYLDSFIDITKRKKMEEALQKAHFELEMRVEERTEQLSHANKSLQKEIEERIRAENDKMKLYWAVHQSTSAIVITDLTGEIEYVNPKFCDITGYGQREVLGKNPRILKSGELTNEIYKEMWGMISRGEEWYGEYKNKRKDGSLFWVSAAISPIRNLEGKITNYLSVQEDITERKRNHEELIIAKERAEESEKLKSILMANMSHEFRTPLIGILGFSQILESEIEDEGLLSMVNSISMSGQRLMSTLNGILSLSQMETIDLSDSLKEVNLSEEITIVISELRDKALEKNLTLTSSITEQALKAFVDVDLFTESLKNIIENAIIYTNEGMVEVNAEIVENGRLKDIQIKVSDTGIGIADDDKTRIFEAFRQASEGYSRDYEGVGLGLTIAKKYIEMLDGTITLESEPGKGSTFTITIPCLV